MKNYTFRDLTIDDVEVRVAMARQNGVSLLIYKDARVDQTILDETVGQMNWKKSYKVIKDNLYCSIEIWDGEKSQWVSKEDCGVESNTEKEKGEASDAQKRSGFVWGIGRELYSAPFIWISNDKCQIEQSNNAYRCKDSFKVTKMTVKDKKIVELEITNENTGKVVYQMKHNSSSKDEVKPEKEDKQVTNKTTKTSISLKEALSTSITSKSGTKSTIQQVIDGCTTNIQQSGMLKWLKEQAISGKENSDACKAVSIAIEKGMINFPTIA